MRQAVIIADDLTGACDTGVKLAAKGYDAQVILDAQQLAETQLRDDSFYTISTNTRSVTGTLAYAAVKQVASVVHAQTPRVIYKKIDSVLRGNAGVEIDAVLDATGLAMAVIAPALPRSGRIVKNGILYVKTPYTGEYTKNVAESLYGGAADGKCLNLTTAQVRCGSEELAQKLDELAGRGCRYCLADAQSDEDLALIAGAIQRCRTPILPVGSAGLAEQMFGIKHPVCGSDELEIGDGGENVGVVVVTSKHPSTMAQLQQLRSRRDTAIFTFDTAELERTDPVWISQRLAAQILRYWRNHTQTRLLVITTQANMTEKDCPVPETDLSDEGIATAATNAAAIVTRALPVTAIIASGGDTASYYLANFTLKRVKLLEEPIPGTVAARMDVAGEPSRLLLTKSGGFGDENTLDRLADYMLSHRVSQN